MFAWLFCFVFFLVLHFLFCNFFTLFFFCIVYILFTLRYTICLLVLFLFFVLLFPPSLKCPPVPTPFLLGRHNTVHLLQLVGKSLLLREFVLLQGDRQLLVVFDRVRVQLVQGAVCVELGRVELLKLAKMNIFPDFF